MNQDDALDDSGSQMIVSVESHDVLELTITKTNLKVFTELGKVCISRTSEDIRLRRTFQTHHICLKLLCSILVVWRSRHGKHWWIFYSAGANCTV